MDASRASTRAFAWLAAGASAAILLVVLRVRASELGVCVAVVVGGIQDRVACCGL